MTENFYYSVFSTPQSTPIWAKTVKGRILGVLKAAPGSAWRLYVDWEACLVSASQSNKAPSITGRADGHSEPTAARLATHTAWHANTSTTQPAPRLADPDTQHSAHSWRQFIHCAFTSIWSVPANVPFVHYLESRPLPGKRKKEKKKNSPAITWKLQGSYCFVCF